MNRVTIGLFTLFLFVLAACGTEAPTATPVPPTQTPFPPPVTLTPAPVPAGVTGPAHITVQHILIAFAGTGTAATRSQADAKKLAYDLLAQVKAGADFDQLMKANSDDTGPGIYSMSNTGVAPNQAAGEYPREGMVPAFGNVGFTLQVGEIGIADFDPQTSPFGYHIIKRLK